MTKPDLPDHIILANARNGIEKHSRPSGGSDEIILSCQREASKRLFD